MEESEEREEKGKRMYSNLYSTVHRDPTYSQSWAGQISIRVKVKVSIKRDIQYKCILYYPECIHSSGKLRFKENQPCFSLLKKCNGPLVGRKKFAKGNDEIKFRQISMETDPMNA